MYYSECEMEIKFNYKTGQTPYDDSELEGLKLKNIKSQEELEANELKGIVKTKAWLDKNNFESEKIFTEPFLKEIHKRMFGDVWSWAGKYRSINKTRGVEKTLIAKEIKQAISNTLLWIESESYEPDEIAIRFMHRLMQIQCFPNGNAKHAKLMADIIVEHIFYGDAFSWGRKYGEADNYAKFISCLQNADKGKIKDLLLFARS